MRPEEAEIPLEYLQMIHEKHEKWFEEYDKVKVLIIDTDVGFKGDEGRIAGIMERLKGFLYPEGKEIVGEKEGMDTVE